MNPLSNLTKDLKRSLKNFRRNNSSENKPTKIKTLKGTLNMENETPQKEQTGGLKLMTVFVVVLALHLVVIGGVVVFFHFFKSGNKDAVAAEAEKTDSTVAKSTEDSNGAAGGPNIQTDDAGAAKPATPNASVDGAKTGDALENETPGQTLKPADSSTAATALPPETVDASTVTDSTKPVGAPVATPATRPMASATPETATPAIAAGSATYTVKSGDTLSKIAKRNGVKIAELKKLNGLKSNVIRVGQVLKLNPSTDTTSVASAPVSTPAAPAAVAAAAAAAPETKMAIAKTVGARIYKVSSGDTLYKIAKKFNTSAAAIMAANKIADANKLKVGTSLTIPQRTDKRSVTETPAETVPTRTASNGAPDLVMNQ